MITENGTVFYQDEYQTIYDVTWETEGDNLDITSVVSQPYIYGQEDQGYVQNNKVFRLGTITVTRQIIRVFDGGYEIIAEGTSQYYDYIQVNFVCEEGPYDNFTYHIDCSISDIVEGLVSDGSHWVDPEEVISSVVPLEAVDSTGSEWGDVYADGTPISTAAQSLEWIDVWQLPSDAEFSIADTTGYVGSLSASQNLATTGSRVFPGTDETFTLATAISPGTNDFWVSFWIYFNATSTDQCPIRFYQGTPNFYHFYPYLSNTGTKLTVHLGDSSQALNWSPDTSTWYNLVFNCDRDGNCDVYVNNELLGSLDISSHASKSLGGTDAYVGSAGTNLYVNGHMARVGYGTGLLAASDIAEFWNYYNGKLAVELSAALLAKCSYYANGNEGGTNDDLVDQIGSNDGTKSGTGDITSAAGPRQAIAADLDGLQHGTLTSFVNTLTCWNTDTPDGSYTVTKVDSVGSNNITMTDFEDIDVCHVDSPYGEFGPYIQDQVGTDNGWMEGNTSGDTRSAQTPKGQFVTGSLKCYDNEYDEISLIGAREFTRTSNHHFDMTAALDPGSNDFWVAFRATVGTIPSSSWCTVIVTGATASNTGGFWLAIREVSSTYRVILYLQDDDDVSAWSGDFTAFSPATLQQDTHYILKVDRTASEATLYINGVKHGTSLTFTPTGPLTPESTHGMQIGGYSSTAHMFEGSLSHIQCGVATLDSDDIAALFNGGRPLNYANMPAAQQAKTNYAWDGDESTAGDDLVDSSGNGNTGSDDGTVGVTSGPYLPAYDLTLTGFTSSPRITTIPTQLSGVKAIAFSITGGYALSTKYTLTGQGARTVAVWFRGTSTTSQEYWMGECATSVGNKGFTLNYYQATDTIICRVQDSSGTIANGSVASGSNYLDGDWHCFVFRWDGTTDTNKVETFIDSSVTPVTQNTATATSQGAASTYPFQINGRGGDNIKADIDLCLPTVTSGRAWTDTEVAAFMNDGTTPSDSTSLWDFDEEDTCQFVPDHCYLGASDRGIVIEDFTAGSADSISFGFYHDGTTQGVGAAGFLRATEATYIYGSSVDAIYWHPGGGDRRRTTTGSLSVGWHFVTLTPTGAWIDGEKATDIYDGGGVATSKVLIGARQSTSLDSGFAEKITHFIAHDTTPTIAEIRQFAQGFDITGTNMWKFDNTIDLTSLNGAKALSFPTANNYADAGDPSEGTDQFTISFWVRKNSPPAASAYVMSRYDTNSQRAWGIRFDTTTGYITANVSTNGTTINGISDGATNFCDGYWHHVALVVDYAGAGLAYLYVDGNFMDDQALGSALHTSTANVILGGVLATGSLASPLTGGEIGNPKIYSSPLTQSQVRSIISSDYATGLINDWLFKDAARSIANCANGLSIDFDGVSARIVIPDGAFDIFDGTQEGTICFWIKKGYSQTPTSNEFTVSLEGAYAVTCDTTGPAGFATGTASDAANSTTNIYDGSWHHIAFTWTAAAQKILIDGSEDVSDVPSLLYDISALSRVSTIGSQWNSGSNTSGRIKDVRVYSTALSEANLATLVAGTDPAGTIESRYSMNDGPQGGQISNGDPVSIWWTYLGKRLEFYQEDADARPVYMNGYLQFDGAQFLEYAGKVLEENGGAILVRCQNDGSTANSYVLCQTDSDTAGTFLCFGYSLDEYARIAQQNDGDTAIDATGTNALSGINIIAYMSDGSAYFIDVDSEEEVVAATDGDWGADTGIVNEIDNTTIGAMKFNSTIVNYLDGRVYEIHIWDGNVNFADVRRQAELMAS